MPAAKRVHRGPVTGHIYEDEPRYCQGCGREMFHGRPDKTWCTEACRQRTLRDRRWLALAAAMNDRGVNRRALVTTITALFGDSIAAAEARAEKRSSSGGQAETG